MSLAILLLTPCRLAHESPTVQESTIPKTCSRLGLIPNLTPFGSRCARPATRDRSCHTHSFDTSSTRYRRVVHHADRGFSRASRSCFSGCQPGNEKVPGAKLFRGLLVPFLLLASDFFLLLFFMMK